MLIMMSLATHARTNLPEVDKKLIELYNENIYSQKPDGKDTYFEEVSKLQKAHKNYLPLETSLISALSMLGLGKEAEVLYHSQWDKKKSRENEFLHYYSQITSWKISPDKLKEILAKMEKLIDKKNPTSDLNYNIQMTLIHKSRTPEQKTRAAEYLLKNFPNDMTFQRNYPRVLAMEGKLDILIKRCNEELAKKDEDLRSCISLLSAKVERSPKQEEEIKKINQLCETLSREDFNEDKKSKKFLISLYQFISDQELPELTEKIAQKIVVIEKDWIPSASLREYFKLENYEQYKLFDELYKVTSTPDVKTKIEELKKLQDKLAPYKALTNYLYQSLVSSYLHPTIKDNSDAIDTLEEWLDYDKENDFAKTKLVELYIKEDKKLEKALELVNDSISFADENISKNQKYFSNYSEFFDYYKKEYAALYRQKGEIYEGMDKYEMAIENLKKSFMIAPMPLTAYHLFKSYNELDKAKDSYEWALISLVKTEESLDKEHSEEAHKSVIKYLSKYTQYSKIKVSDALISKIVESKNSLYNLGSDNTKGPSAKKEKHPLIGKDIIPLPLNTLKKAPFKWETLKGKNVLLSFWATWCVPCIQELTVLDKLKKEYKGKPFEIVAVCTDGLMKKKDMHKILKKANITSLEVLVGKGESFDKYGFNAIPTSFYVNPKGKIIDMGQGYSENLEEEIKKKLDL